MLKLVIIPKTKTRMNVMVACIGIVRNEKVEEVSCRLALSCDTRSAKAAQMALKGSIGRRYLGEAMGPLTSNM